MVSASPMQSDTLLAGRSLDDFWACVHFQFISIRLVGLSRLLGVPDAGNPVLIRRWRQSRPTAHHPNPPFVVAAPPGRRLYSAPVIGAPLSSHDSRSTWVVTDVATCIAEHRLERWGLHSDTERDNNDGCTGPHQK